MIHVRALGPSDQLHYLWDFTGEPACLILSFNVTTPVRLTIDWLKFFDGQEAIVFDPKPQYFFGAVLQTLFEYNDREDRAHFENVTDPADLIQYPMRNFIWEREYLNVTPDRAEVRVVARTMTKAPHSPIKNATANREIGNIALTFVTNGLAGHSEQIPHLMHTENSTEIDLILKDIVVEKNFSCTRLALGLTVVSMDDAKANLSLALNKSLDDEFTPGIFELVNMGTHNLSRFDNGFLQYRPVSYTNLKREVAESTLIRQTEPQHVYDPTEALNETIFVALEGFKIDGYLVQSINVSFGVAADGCLQKQNYTTWTFIAAYGAPGEERLSIMVKIVASLGLGIPLLLVICGGCYLCVKKARSDA